MKERLNKVYAPILEKVYQEVNKLGKLELHKDIPDIFIPGFGKEYADSNKKIMYIGKDTNGWYSLNESAAIYGAEKSEKEKRNVLEKTILRASNSLQSNCHIDWWEGGKSQFWDYIFRLQELINNLDSEKDLMNPGNECIKLKKDWLEENTRVTQGFAWANAKMLQELNLERDVTESEFYKKIRELTYRKEEERNEVFKLAIEALNPDIIVILNWDEYLSFIGKHDENSSYYDEYKDKGADSQLDLERIKIEYYHLENEKHVFWTYHPRATIYNNRGGVEKWAHAMFKFMKDKQVFKQPRE